MGMPEKSSLTPSQFHLFFRPLCYRARFSLGSTIVLRYHAMLILRIWLLLVVTLAQHYAKKIVIK